MLWNFANCFGDRKLDCSIDVCRVTLLTLPPLFRCCLLIRIISTMLWILMITLRGSLLMRQLLARRMMTNWLLIIRMPDLLSSPDILLLCFLILVLYFLVLRLCWILLLVVTFVMLNLLFSVSLCPSVTKRGRISYYGIMFVLL